MYIVKAGPPEAEVVALQAMLDFLRLGRTVGDNASDDNLIKALIRAAREYAEDYTGRSLAKKPYMQVHDSFPYYVDAVQSRDAYPPSYYSAPRYSTTMWNYSQQIKLMFPPLISVESIKYIDPSGNEQTLLSGKDFQFDPATEPGRLFPLPGQNWPACLYCANAVRIFFTAGYEVDSAEEPAGETDSPTVPEPETDEVTGSPATNQVTTYSIDRTIPTNLALAMKQLVTHWYQNRDPVIAAAGAGGKFATLPAHFDAIFDQYRCIDYCPTRG